MTRKTMMTPARFEALADLIRMRKGSPSREAARLVMVWGYSGMEAAGRTGVSKAGVYAATARIRKGLQLARQAVGLSD
jgi:transposase